MQSLKNPSSVPALFLDRDGVLNEDVGYCYRLEDLRVKEGAIALLNTAKKSYKLIVVTNQSGIARGIYTTDHMRDFNRELQAEILRQGGPKLDAIYWCPHLEEGSVAVYARACSCRKPGIAMIQAASAYLNIDLERSFLLGDKHSDVEAAAGSGIRGILIGKGPGSTAAYAQVESMAMASALIASAATSDGDLES